MTGEMKEAAKVDLYIEDKKVLEVQPSGKTTPLDEPIFTVTLEGDEKVEMSNARFKAMQTIEKSDATKARNALVKELGQRMYALLMEYGIKLPEIDPVLNEVVRLANDAQHLADKTLWGNEPYDRSLLDVNAILMDKYGDKKEETPESGDGAASSGSDADPAAKD